MRVHGAGVCQARDYSTKQLQSLGCSSVPATQPLGGEHLVPAVQTEVALSLKFQRETPSESSKRVGSPRRSGSWVPDLPCDSGR